MTGPRCTHTPTGAAAEAAAAMRAAIPRLETARLILRAPEITDLPVWTEAFMAEWAEASDTEERAWEEFSYYTACWILHGHGLWALERRDDDVVVGFVLLGLEWTDEEPELGYIIAAAHRRNGYAKEACQAARDHGLHLLGPGTVVSYVEPTNTASNGLAAKLNAVRDAAAEASMAEDIHIWRYGASG